MQARRLDCEGLRAAQPGRPLGRVRDAGGAYSCSLVDIQARRIDAIGADAVDQASAHVNRDAGHLALGRQRDGFMERRGHLQMEEFVR